MQLMCKQPQPQDILQVSMLGGAQHIRDCIHRNSVYEFRCIHQFPWRKTFAQPAQLLKQLQKFDQSSNYIIFTTISKCSVEPIFRISISVETSDLTFNLKLLKIWSKIACMRIAKSLAILQIYITPISNFDLKKFSTIVFTHFSLFFPLFCLDLNFLILRILFFLFYPFL